MEEQKKAKSVKLQSNESKEAQKYSYEELLNICDQQQKYINNLMGQLQQAKAQIILRRIDYLFKVLEHSDIIADKEFIDTCIAEIKEAIIIPETPKES